MRPFAFQKVNDAAEALKNKKPEAQFIAGGTNLVDLMKKHIAQPEALLDVSGALSKDIVSGNKGILIGAMARNTDLTLDKDILARYPLVARAVLAGASPQIRNMASVGGNLLQRTRCPYFYDVSTPCNKRKPGSGCSALNGAERMSAIVGYNEQCVAVHPSDLCVALAALDAEVRIMTPDKKEKTLRFRDFHKLPEATPWKDNTLPENALIAHVYIPENPFYQHYAYLKLRDRTSYAFALVSVAAALHLENGKIKAARLASGGVAHKPWRWYEAEEFLKGKTPSAEVFAEAAERVVKGIKPLAGNAFKVPMLKGAVETALQNCITPLQ